MLHAHGGDIYGAAAEAGVAPSEILDFSANVNPVPVPDAVRVAVAESADALQHYPDPLARTLRERAAAFYGVSPDCLLAGNGSTEFIYAVPQRLAPRRVVILAPSYHEYWRAVEHAGGEAEGLVASAQNEFAPDLDKIKPHLSGADMLIIGNPNDPTGTMITGEAIRTLAGTFPQLTILVDESLVDFVPEGEGASLLGEAVPENAIVLRSLSMSFGLPGLRLGFMIASPETIAHVDSGRRPWTVSVTAMRAGEALMAAGCDAAAMRETMIAERERLRDELSQTPGLRVFRSQANFMLLRITKPGLSAAQVCDRMLKQKILIRNAAGFRGLDNRFVRVSVRTAADNGLLIAALRAALDEGRWK